MRLYPLVLEERACFNSSTTQKCELKDTLTEYEGVVGILLSKVEISQIICESIYARPQRACLLARVSMNEINSFTTQKCEMRDALTEYEGVIGILLSKVEILQIICESISTRLRRASPLSRVSVSQIYFSTTQKCEIGVSLIVAQPLDEFARNKVYSSHEICMSESIHPA